ncbi:ScbA/BarX family gamma-butyrolactone biosynthesis protein [Streptomyces sp. NPDC048664]|uniref:ScbA/BarX family gamma-butyrolactone biosynthesis protein n=1 Tax=Streptomyces sp. NPDC048664 TaxID=3154505 RepID=UPI00341B9D32
MAVLTFHENDRSIPGEPCGPSVGDVAELPRLTTTVPREYVHRSSLAEVFLTGCTKLDDTHFALSGQWPRAHTFFTSADGVRHDPMQAAETIRQTGLYLAHAELGVPLGHQFLMWDLHVTAYAERLAIGAEPSDLDLTAVCTSMKWKGKRLSEFSMEISVERDGVACAVGGGRFTCIAPATYQRLRAGAGARAGSGPGRGHGAGRTHPPAAPEASVFGRTLPFDVVLSPSDRPGRWLLDPDPRHPILFDHSGDHMPGMVLLEAARQAACGLLHPEPLTPSDIQAEFFRYAEFGAPCWIEAGELPEDGDGSRRVLVTGRQEGETVFTARIAGPVDPSRASAP